MHNHTQLLKSRLKEILLKSDLSFASFVLGVAMFVWGLVAVIMAPGDFFTFSQDMRVSWGMWFWFLNYTVVGISFMVIALHNFPPIHTLITGGYATMVWNWIASTRGYSNFTSGVTLNFVVIFLGIMVVYRSGKNGSDSE